MADFAELIARLEKAAGHDDDLNFDIAISQGWEPHQAIIDGETFTAKWTTPSGETKILCPWFTSSIDAAVTLVPERHRWLLDKRPDADQRPEGYRAQVYRQGHHYKSDMSDMPTTWAATPAIALTSAALKARCTFAPPQSQKDTP